MSVYASRLCCTYKCVRITQCRTVERSCGRQKLGVGQRQNLAVTLFFFFATNLAVTLGTTATRVLAPASTVFHASPHFCSLHAFPPEPFSHSSVCTSSPRRSGDALPCAEMATELPAAGMAGNMLPPRNARHGAGGAGQQHLQRRLGRVPLADDGDGLRHLAGGQPAGVLAPALHPPDGHPPAPRHC